MGTIRKALGGLLSLLGVYYCVVSVRTLLRLPNITERWIQLSGDPDFKYDYGMFLTWIGTGAVLVGVLGFRTAVKGVAAAQGRGDSWLWLAISALSLHWFWFLYRTIGTGLLGREAQAIAQRENAIRFGTICTAYLLMWIIMRGRQAASRSANNRLQPTAAGAMTTRRG
jgi:hypothetical protein